MTDRRQAFQVWIAECDPWRPRHWYDRPRRARAVELADRCATADEARQVVEGFNRRMLHKRGELWAVAVPVKLQIAGEPQRGERLRGVRELRTELRPMLRSAHKKNPSRVCQKSTLDGLIPRESF